jgi:multiple sugar transport system substrate-binding protein
MMKRLSIRRIYPLAVVLSVVLAACSQPAPAAPTSAPTTAPTTLAPTTVAPAGEVSFMMFGEPAEVAAFQTVADGFEAQNPGAKVTLVPVPGDEEEYHARLASELVGGTPPDVVLIDYDAAAQFYDTGALQSLSIQMGASSVLDPAGLYTPAYEAFQWNGEQMCLPLSISSFVVYYNKALFDAAGQAYPKAAGPGMSFLATAQALTKDTDGDGKTDQFGLGFSPGINNVLPFIWQNGGDLLAEGGQKLALDTPQAREAIQFVVDWQTKYHIVPNRTEETAQSSDERFEAGTLAMRIASRAATPDWRTLSDLDWDVGPLPRRAQAGNILRSTACACRARPRTQTWPGS